MGNTKKLERDLSNKVIGGVCSGIARHLNIDVTLVRILFIVGMFSLSIGFWAYIIFWIVMPGNRYCHQCEQHAEDDDNSTCSQPISKRGSLIIGLCFIIFGIILLIINFIPNIDWNKYWPILLIIVGICMLIPNKKDSNNK